VRTSDLVTLHRDGEHAPVLIVACVGDTPERPHYGIFTRRQVDSVRRLGVHCDLLAIAGYRSPRAYAVAAAELARMSVGSNHRYALVHAHGGEAAVAATGYFRAPLLASYQGSDLLGSPNGRNAIPIGWRARSMLIRQHARLTAATITKSRVMEAVLPASARTRNHVIPNGVDRELFKPCDRDAARADLGWDLDERVVLYASDPSRPSKHPDLARAACERASASVGPVRLHVAHGLRPEVMPDLMNASNCLLHPSASEGSPNVVKEALACNLPVVATPVGDVPELLAGVEHCHVCEPSVDELAAGLVSCLDPPCRSDGRERSRELDEQLIAERIVSVYVEIAGERIRETTAGSQEPVSAPSEMSSFSSGV
jgi:glycosyltransferase involved in cell wall biosynthesis